MQLIHPDPRKREEVKNHAAGDPHPPQKRLPPFLLTFLRHSVHLKRNDDDSEFRHCSLYLCIRPNLDKKNPSIIGKGPSPVLELPLFPRRVFNGLRATNGGRYLTSKREE